MLKMFSTQLTHFFKKVQEQNEFTIEDGARLIAQSAVNNGVIFIRGFQEMRAVESEAIDGPEPFSKAVKKMSNPDEVSPEDRVILFSRFSNNAGAVYVAKNLAQRNIPVVAVCTVIEAEENEADLANYADVLIDLGLKKGLLPDETGNRVGYPGAMAGLFVYHALKFTLDEILADFE
jgi:uncharacterized phosphosugar-binding protein